MEHQYDRGLKAENFLASKMNSLGLKYSFEDAWYDFLVNGCKVEVKSCELTIRQQRIKGKVKKEDYRCGHFDFTKEENREKQYNENIWVCFIMRYRDDFMLMGFARAKELQKKRYITIHGLSRIKLLTVSEWVKQI